MSQVSVEDATDFLSVLPNVSFTCGPVTLVVPTFTQTLALAKHLYNGLWDSPADSTLGRTWYSENATDRGRMILAYYMDAWVTYNRPNAPLAFAALVNNEVVGYQGLEGFKAFWQTREAETVSWISKDSRGRKFAIPMRYAALHIGFSVLGANVMRSGALVQNRASQVVSERCGYDWDGTETQAVGEYVDHGIRYRLSREKWDTWDRPDVVCTGAQDLYEWFCQRHPMGK